MRLLSTFADSDTISELLRSLRVRSQVFCLANMRAPWGFGVPAREVASFHIVLDGGGILEVGGEQAVAVGRGDLVVLPHGDAHVVRDRPGSPVTSIAALEPDTETSWEVRGVTDVLFAQAIRVHLLAQPIAVLGDPQIGAAVRLIHADPVRPWTVTELAAAVALSRSAFSSRFRTLTDESPMRYVARFRLARAAELLRSGDAPLAAVARASGYGSEASFSRAFQRWFG